MTKPIFVLNGPNLNLLGQREPEIYGHETLADINELVATHAKTHGLEVDCRQSNHEGILVDWIQEARESASAIIINAAAYTHTSLAILDALKMFSGPIIEVHISDPIKREQFRHFSYVSEVAEEAIAGHGFKGYLMAVDKVVESLQS